MKLSVIISVYQSYGATQRQARHFAKMALPDDVEFIIVDDGSTPPHRIEDYALPGLRLLYTNNDLAWTQGLGRNLGAKEAQGEYLLLTDMDHILSREAIEAVRGFDGAYMNFPRYFAVLLEDGTLSQDLAVLRQYGLHESRFVRGGKPLYASVHQNTFAMRRSLFLELGGYSRWSCTRGYHPGSKQGDDCHFFTKVKHWLRDHDAVPIMGPPIYLFPIGEYHVRGETNPLGLFHSLDHGRKELMRKGEELYGR